MRDSLLAVLAIIALLLAGCSVAPFKERTTITETKRVPCPVVPVRFECEGSARRLEDFLDMTPAEVMREWGRGKRREACLEGALAAWRQAHEQCTAREEGWLW